MTAEPRQSLQHALRRHADSQARYSAYDGRLSDLGNGAPASLVPLVSDNWSKVFTWQGTGPMPADERERLRSIVAQAHAKQRNAA